MTDIDTDGIEVNKHPLADSCIVLSWTQHKMGINRKASADDIEISDTAGVGRLDGATLTPEEKKKAKDSISTVVKLFSCEEYKKIVSLDGEISRWLKTRSHSSKILKGGMGFVPLDAVKEVREKYEFYMETRKVYVNEFINKYEEIVAEALKNPLVQEKDFPSKGDVGKLFWASYQMTAFSSPTVLKKVSPEMFEQEQSRIAGAMDDAVGEIIAMVRGQFASMLDSMIEKLAMDPETGKKKSFKDSSITGFKDFLDSFNTMNVAGDEELAALVAKAKMVMDTTNADELRTNVGMRNVVSKSFDKIKAQMSTLITNKPIRAIDFSD